MIQLLKLHFMLCRHQDSLNIVEAFQLILKIKYLIEKLMIQLLKLHFMLAYTTG